MLKKMGKLFRYLKFMLSTLGGTAVDCGVMWFLAEVLFAESEFVGLFIGSGKRHQGRRIIKMVPFILIRHFAGLNVVLCNLIALVFSGIFNFVMNEWVIFRKKS